MSGRITAKRVAHIQSQLGDDDLHVLKHLALTKLVCGHQVRRLTSSVSVHERRALQRRLLHLTELRVLSRLGRRIGGVKAGSDGYVYALDVVGQRIVDPEPRRQWRPPWTPSVRTLNHALSVSELYVRLVEAERTGSLELLSFTTEPACWRSFVGPGGARLILKPDAHLIVGTDETEIHAWIEMDMATESLAWITEKARTYGRYFATGKEQTQHGVFPTCLWIAPDQARANGLIDALSRLPAEDWQLHQVTTATDTLDDLLGQHQLITGEPQP